MNKRRFGLTVAVCMLVTALAAGAAIARVGSPLTGRFLLGDQNTPILIDSSGTPIILTDRTGSDLFDGLSNGDRILVFLSPVAETYPARAGAYFCLRLSSGAPEDLPQQSLQTLAELGWLTLPLPAQSNVFSQTAA